MKKYIFIVIISAVTILANPAFARNWKICPDGDLNPLAQVFIGNTVEKKGGKFGNERVLLYFSEDGNIYKKLGGVRIEAEWYTSCKGTLLTSPKYGKNSSFKSPRTPIAIEAVKDKEYIATGKDHNSKAIKIYPGDFFNLEDMF